jgi:hypothetical protein
VEEIGAKQIISQIALNVEEAEDNLLQAKIFQAHYANCTRGPEPKYAVGDKVMLSTLHQCNEYKKKGEKCVAKFFPRFDGPYVVVDTHHEMSNYMLELPNQPNVFPIYHASELAQHVPNDPMLFPTHKKEQPPPIVTPNGIEEYLIEEIINSCRCRRGWQYLI